MCRCGWSLRGPNSDHPRLCGVRLCGALPSETADEDKSEAQRGASESSTASELLVVAMLPLPVEATRRAALLAHLFAHKHNSEAYVADDDPGYINSPKSSC